MFRFVCILAAIAVCNAGIANYNGATVIAPTITSEQQNVLRSYGNLQQVSYNSKTIDTPYSSVSKSDVRVSNPGISYAQPLAYAQPATYSQAAYAPATYSQAAYAPATYSQAAYAPATYSQAAYAPATYSQAAYAPAATYHQPAQVYSSYRAPAAYHAQAYAPAQPLAYSSPQVVAPATKLLGVAYSPATAVSHMSYSAPLISYAW